MSFLWTPTEIANLRAYYAEASWPKLLRILRRRTRGGIEYKAQSLGLARGKSLKPRIIALLVIRNPRFTSDEIAERVGCSPSRVRQIRLVTTRDTYDEVIGVGNQFHARSAA
jgi:hypothetical protein